MLVSNSFIAGAQEFEAAWWGNCCNTFSEECKQIAYASRMGLSALNVEGHWPVFDLQGVSVLDIGGGPASMLLKCVDLGKGCVVADPCPYPDWVGVRYEAHGVKYTRTAGEKIRLRGFDEVWVYNVLQHVVDPERVIANALRAGRVLRIFEWLETPPSEGHPHTLTAGDLDTWIGVEGNVGFIDEQGAVGLAYSGAIG